MPAPPAAEARDALPRTPAPLSSAAIRGRRTAVVLLAVTWCLALGWLALATSNPVTLNRRQILEADAVVTGRITDRAAGACRVERQWRGTAVPEEIVVHALAETAVGVDGAWILPLKRTRRGYEVQPTVLPSQARLVYPATEKAVTQLERLVAQGG